MAIIIDEQLQNFLFARILFSQNLESAFIPLPCIDIATGNFDGLAGEPDQALDIVFLHIFRVPENDDVPPIGTADLVGKLVDENSIPLEDGQIADLVGITAVWANGIFDPADQVAIIVEFLAGTDLIVLVTFRTDDIFVSSEQSRSHRPCRNDKGFGDEGSEE